MRFELKNICLDFQKERLFQNLNLSFEGPGIIGILGASGCGKSTLLRLLSGLETPSLGQMTRPDVRQGFVFQDSHLLNWRTTFENVRLPLELQNQNDDDLVEKVLNQVNLSSARHLYPHQLSGGMKMRVSFARSFVLSPQILFCDEPFGALDELTRENLQVLLRTEIMLHKKLCFFVTHSISEALTISDQIYYFKERGEIHPTPYIVKHNNAAFQDQLFELKELLKGSRP